MSTLGKILISALTGTAFMTLYSYSISRKDKEQYREPELLNKLGDRLDRSVDMPERKPAVGFGLHYIMGVGFVSSYVPIWKKTKLKPNWKSGMALGFISGLVGIGIWETTFRLHPKPPVIDKKDFYSQLVVAHVIFGATASEQWRLMEQAE